MNEKKHNISWALVLLIMTTTRAVLNSGLIKHKMYGQITIKSLLLSRSKLSGKKSIYIQNWGSQVIYNCVESLLLLKSLFRVSQCGGGPYTRGGCALAEEIKLLAHKIRIICLERTKTGKSNHRDIKVKWVANISTLLNHITTKLGQRHWEREQRESKMRYGLA